MIPSLQKKKRRDNNNKENTNQEENSSLNLESVLSIEITPMNYSENLNMIVAGMKIKNNQIEDFEQFQKKITKLLGQYKEGFKEYDYRLYNQGHISEDAMKIDHDENLSYIEKMKTIGKIGDEVTILDKDSSNEDLDLKNEKLKVAAKGSFASIRTNNCVFKGKWCYEVVLLSSKLFQIGWCQISTPFRNEDGVGDDITSYAYDGYRAVKWHKKKDNYGVYWDIGDVIGVCIDLEDKKIEYFQNGISLGQAFLNIPTGPNLAYFPGISLSKNERALFNFGSQEMLYKYQGYDPMDIPKSIYKNSYEASQNFLELLDSHILKLLNLKDIAKMIKLSISSRIFNFISNVSFKDFFIFTKLIKPFLLTLSNSTDKEKEDHLKIFLDNCLLYVENRSEFVNSLFENLATLVEYFSARGFEAINEREYLLRLILKLLKIDSIAQLWLEGNKYVDHLKMIIKGNFVKVNDISEEVYKKIENFKKAQPDLKNSKAFIKFYSEFKNEYTNKLEKSGLISYERKANEITIELINYFIHDSRTFVVNRKNLTLKTILIENYTKAIKEASFQGNDIINFMSGYNSIIPNESFIKYFYFNLLDIFSSEIFNLDLSNFSVEPWITRNKHESIYYDEIGIGGTISHVTTEYGSKIDPKFIKQGNTVPSLNNYMLHRVLLMTSNYIIPVLKDYLKNYDKNKELRFEDIEDGVKRGPLIHSIFRSYFSVLTKRNQVLLYQFSYFLINWINSLIKVNKELIYFIPKSIMQLPYEIFKLLIQTKSIILKDDELRKSANNKSKHFEADNYVYQILYFYCYLFHDTNIANPELKEGFINKVSQFLKKKKFMKLFEENEDLLEMLMKGLLNYMANDHMSHFASENIVKIIKPSCFGEKSESSQGKVTLIKVVKVFFEKNPPIFQEFMDNYYKLLNKVMTEYTVSLTEAYSKKNVPNREGEGDRLYSYVKRMMMPYHILCELMKILEFLLTAYPNEFFDINTINFSRFSNFLKNLSSRILDKNYILKFMELVTKYKESKSLEIVSCLVNSVIGIFFNVNENKENRNFSEFVNKLVSQSDFDVDPFYNVLNYIKGEPEHLQAGIKVFKDLLDYFASLKSKKVEMKMTEEEWEATTKRENVCIICYVNETNKTLLPCRHGCCSECLMQYLTDKKHCFICNTPIEKTEDVKKI